MNKNIKKKDKDDLPLWAVIICSIIFISLMGIIIIDIVMPFILLYEVLQLNISTTIKFLVIVLFSLFYFFVMKWGLENSGFCCVSGK